MNGTNPQVRSRKELNFTTIENEIIDNLSFQKPVDKLLYISLCRFTFGNTNAFPSIKTLSLMCCCTENTIRTALKRLEEMKLITIEYRPKEDGNHDTNIYWLEELTETFKEHIVTNPKKKHEKLQQEQKRKEEKKVIKNEGTSKFEGGQNLPQNLKGGTSNFEDYNKFFTNNIKDLVSKYVECDLHPLEFYRLTIKDSYSKTFEMSMTELIQRYDTVFINESIKRLAVKGDVQYHFAFIQSTLAKWIDKAGIRNMEQLKAHEEAFREKQKTKRSKTSSRRGVPIRTEIVPDWVGQQEKEEKHETEPIVTDEDMIKLYRSLAAIGNVDAIKKLEELNLY